jgi:hypothetical protein
MAFFTWERTKTDRKLKEQQISAKGAAKCFKAGSIFFSFFSKLKHVSEQKVLMSWKNILKLKVRKPTMINMI